MITLNHLRELKAHYESCWADELCPILQAFPELVNSIEELLEANKNAHERWDEAQKNCLDAQRNVEALLKK